MKNDTSIDLTIEVTRKCQLECPHCLRGKSQEIDMEIGILERFFDNNPEIKWIDNLNLSGGEPSLNPKLITDFVNLCEKMKITIVSYYLVTNAFFISDSFIKSILDLHLISLNPIKFPIRISSDKYHKESKNRNTMVDKLKVLSFVANSKNDYEQLINSGFARKLKGVKKVNYKPKKLNIQHYEFGFDHIKGDIYINALGEIINGVGYSYASQRRHKIGTINDSLYKIIGTQYD